MKRFVSIWFAAWACFGAASAAGLPPGEHSKTPKLWERVGKHVVNYTPRDFGGRIHALTARGDELWFALGNTLEHIERSGRLTSFPMPAPQWQVGGIAAGPANTVWFSAGQSGRIGFVDAAGHYHFQQLVARRFFPDIRDIAPMAGGDLWFLDLGRASFGHRTPSGRVYERHVTGPQANPSHLAACGGKIWVSSTTPFGLGNFGTLDARARVRPYQLPIMQRGWIEALACDRRQRLWFTYVTPYDREQQRQHAFVGYVDASGKAGFLSGDFSGAGALAAANDGGLWLSVFAGYRPGASPRPTLMHVDRNAQRWKRELPTVPPYSMAVTTDGSLWLDDNEAGSPIAVTRLF